MLWIWIGLIVIFVIVEAATVQLVTVWFAVGGIAGLIAYTFGLEIWMQILIFAVVSAVALAVTRPFVKRFTKGRKQPTNADRYIGQEATVTEPISNELSKGAVRIGGLEYEKEIRHDFYLAQDGVVMEGVESPVDGMVIPASEVKIIKPQKVTKATEEMVRNKLQKTNPSEYNP